MSIFEIYMASTPSVPFGFESLSVLLGLPTGSQSVGTFGYLALLNLGVTVETAKPLCQTPVLKY